MRLIDAHKLWDVMNKAILNHIVTNTLWNTLKSVIENAPTIDAVEVVRCKDCEYRNEEGECDCNLLYMQMEGDLIGVTLAPYADFYCKYGKRREDGGA